ncbi:MAG: FHA domain-containing protein [Gemmataceae bacterium]
MKRIVETTSLARFAHACGAIRPFEIAIERSNGTVISRATISMPCAVIGRDSYCDVYVNDGDIAGRHLALQVIGGRIFAIDLSGKSNGLTFGGVPRHEGWLTEGMPVGIGPHRLVLSSTSPAFPTMTPADYHPLVANSKVVSTFVKSSIEFRNGRTAQSRWDVNRVLTLVGRAKNCKINLTSEDVSLIHCYFLLTHDGLWIVDVFGRGGVLVDGIPVRFARLRQTDDVRIARFHLGCAYPNGDPGDPIIPLSPVATPVKWPDLPRKEKFTPLSDVAPEELRTPLPSIPWSEMPHPANDTPQPRVEMPKELVVPAAGLAAVSDPAQRQMFEQFQQSMLMMMKMFGQMQQQQMTGIQQEMARLANLTEELTRMQSQIASAVGGGGPASLPHHNPLPAPEEVPTMSEESAQQHQFVFEKMAQIEAERQSIWKRLAGMIATKPASA